MLFNFCSSASAWIVQNPFDLYLLVIGLPQVSDLFNDELLWLVITFGPPVPSLYKLKRSLKKHLSARCTGNVVRLQEQKTNSFPEYWWLKKYSETISNLIHSVHLGGAGGIEKHIELRGEWQEMNWRSRCGHILYGTFFLMRGTVLKAPRNRVN